MHRRCARNPGSTVIRCFVWSVDARSSAVPERAGRLVQATDLAGAKSVIGTEAEHPAVEPVEAEYPAAAAVLVLAAVPGARLHLVEGQAHGGVHRSVVVGQLPAHVFAELGQHTRSRRFQAPSVGPMRNTPVAPITRNGMRRAPMWTSRSMSQQVSGSAASSSATRFSAAWRRRLSSSVRPRRSARRARAECARAGTQPVCRRRCGVCRVEPRLLVGGCGLPRSHGLQGPRPSRARRGCAWPAGVGPGPVGRGQGSGEAVWR